jgi:phage shock protein A
MLAKMQSAQARIKVQEQLDGLSVDADVKALDNVREHIKTTIAEANLGSELAERRSTGGSRRSATRSATCRPAAARRAEGEEGRQQPARRRCVTPDRIGIAV